MDTTEKRDVGQVMKRLIAEDGWRGLYRGLGPRFASMSAWGTTMIVAYEYLSKKILPSSRMITLCRSMPSSSLGAYILAVGLSLMIKTNLF